MIDIHCHILPELDDGAKNMEESIAMARTAVNQGIETIIATPHHLNGAYTNMRLDIVQATSQLNKRLQDESLPLHIVPGQEPRIHQGMVQGLEKEQILPLNHTAYVFVELPYDYVPDESMQLLFDMQVAGYKPIIVHPERNKLIAKTPNILYEMVRKGILTQVTAASVYGDFGRLIQKQAFQLLKTNLVHFIATDAHNVTSRGFVLNEAYHTIEKHFDRVMAYRLKENSYLLLEDEDVYCPKPMQVKKKPFLGFL